MVNLVDCENLLHRIMKLEAEKFSLARGTIPLNIDQLRVKYSEIISEHRDSGNVKECLDELVSQGFLLRYNCGNEACYNSYPFILALKLSDLRKYTGLTDTRWVSRPRTMGFDLKYCETPLPLFDQPASKLRDMLSDVRDSEGLVETVIKIAENLYDKYSVEQLKAMTYITSSLAKGSNNVVIIDLPTGAGKTEAFLVPALANALTGGLSIIVYPRKALATDQLRRLIELYTVLSLKGIELDSAYAVVYDGESSRLFQTAYNEVFKRTGIFDSQRVAKMLGWGDEVRLEPRLVRHLTSGIETPKLNVKIYSSRGILKAETVIPISDIRLEDLAKFVKVGLLVTNYDMLNRLLSNVQLIDIDRMLEMYKRILIVFDEAHEFKGVDFVHLLMLIYRLYLRALEHGKPLTLVISSATLPQGFNDILRESLGVLLGSQPSVEVVSFEKHGKRRVSFIAFVLPDAETSGQWLDQLGLFLITMSLEARSVVFGSKWKWHLINFVDSKRYLKDIYSNANKTLFNEKETVLRDHLPVLSGGSLPEQLDWSDVITYNSGLSVDRILQELSKVPNEWKEPGQKGYLAQHHADLPPDHRNKLEEAMRRSPYPRAVIATSTLEMGIDIGDIFAILQFRKPPSPESFIQRIGRAGRSGNTLHTALAAVFLSNMPSDALLLLDRELQLKYIYACIDHRGSRYGRPERVNLVVNESIVLQHLVLELLSRDKSLASRLRGGRSSQISNIGDLKKFIEDVLRLLDNKSNRDRLKKLLEAVKIAYSKTIQSPRLKNMVLGRLDNLIDELDRRLRKLHDELEKDVKHELTSIAKIIGDATMPDKMERLRNLIVELETIRRL